MTESAVPVPDQSTPRDKRRKSTGDFWRACGFLWPYRKTVAVSIGCAFGTGLFAFGGLALLLPLMQLLIKQGKTVSQAASEFAATYGPNPPFYIRTLEWAGSLVPTDPVWAIFTVFCGIFLFSALGAATRFFQEYLSDSCAIASINDIRRKLYHHVLHLPVGYFAKKGTGDLTARLVTDAQGLQDGFKTVLGKAIQEPILAAVSLTLAMLIEWRLTIFIIVFTPIMVTIIRKLGTKVRRTMRAALEKNSRMLGQIDSTLTGIRVVKSATAEPFERRRYGAIMTGLLSDQRRVARYEAWSTPALELLGIFAIGCILMFASVLLFRMKDSAGNPELSPDRFFLLMACLISIAEPMRRISKLNSVVQRANACAGRIFEILETPDEAKTDAARKSSATRLPAPPKFTTDISFEHLTFSYEGTTQPALSDVSLTVPKGTSVAIVGRNGSGKTTLLSLLARFFEPTGGAIRIDGVDIRDWPIRRLRRMIGIVTQEAIVFPGTIAQNIAYADPRKSIEQVIDASKRAHAHEFITQKPNGYDTTVDGLGSGMSGGQRQRMNIARAILRDTPILILDEATSQVDAESEHLIQQAVSQLMKDRTTFVIAHRFSTILSADLIVVMEQGKIVGQGKHDELLGTCEVYKQLYERQLFAA